MNDDSVRDDENLAARPPTSDAASEQADVGHVVIEPGKPAETGGHGPIRLADREEASRGADTDPNRPTSSS
jgi:hypothetical protein